MNHWSFGDSNFYSPRLIFLRALSKRTLIYRRRVKYINDGPYLMANGDNGTVAKRMMPLDPIDRRTRPCIALLKHEIKKIARGSA